MTTSVDLMLHNPLEQDDDTPRRINTMNNVKSEENNNFHGNNPPLRLACQNGGQTVAETEVARFKREREERIRGMRLSQSIKSEEQSRRAADIEARRLWDLEQARLAAVARAAGLAIPERVPFPSSLPEFDYSPREKEMRKVNPNGSVARERKEVVKEVALSKLEGETEKLQFDDQQRHPLKIPKIDGGLTPSEEANFVEKHGDVQSIPVVPKKDIFSGEEQETPVGAHTLPAVMIQGPLDLISKKDDANLQDQDQDQDQLASESESARLQKEEQGRLSAEAEAVRVQQQEQARLAAEAEAARLQQQEQARLAAEAEAARLQKEEEERERLASEAKAVRLQKEEQGRLVVEAETARLQKEERERERLASEAEAVRLQKEEQGRLVVEAETARLQKEERERERLASEAEAARLQKEELEQERLASEAEAARLQRKEQDRVAAEAGDLKLLKEEEKRMMAQAEEARRHEDLLMKASNMKKKIAAQTEAARTRKEQEDEQSKRFSSTHRPESAASIHRPARRPASATLRRHRSQQGQKEEELRDIMQGISVSGSVDSDESVETSTTFHTTESLVSHNRNLASGQGLKWETIHLHISFGLLTTEEDAPQSGLYQPFETVEGASMLQKIMVKINNSSKKVLEDGSGNVVMKCQHPFVTAVNRDGKLLLQRMFTSCTANCCIFLMFLACINTNRVIS